MNILIDLVPEEVEINGVKYKIRSDFRTSILFELLMQDNDIEDELKLQQALKLYFPKLPPTEDFEEALKKIIWFYGGGREEKEVNSKKNNSSSRKEKNIYSFEYDDEYIYSAFLSQYKVDLQDIDYLHWWKFKAMFKGLTEENTIVKIMKYRSIDLNSIKDKEERKFYKEMQELYALPNIKNKAEDEKLRAIEDALMEGKVLNLY
ncbi:MULTISPECIES: bacteriophage Gp15 family protein [Clostridium]|uniref:bacteriophage Gp15 family protein n=1 Tax=Clostridium TaxID=1485 RepID=UPI00016BCFF0|nr:MULTISPECIES: bacteriophage Gp15 family protein [Clostridium]EDT26136.1 putative protein gp15 [Clostridium perfringens CPE str. F4969]MDH5064917.1 Bacteriophage Gp15 protein [Clostridium perfringens]MDM0627467.1 bacteriophage Gp15 family protein [Clostridium perfringens]MDU2094856.1 bacteriophage Gp15 family protein [Clostridium perfringens]MDU2227813.1 bacteriophage Gp15 family protein [Clostridium perfringens]